MFNAPPKTVFEPKLRELTWSGTMLLGIVFIAGYVLLDWVSYIYPTQRYNITPWNPQPALAIALLMVGGRRWLPAVFIATTIAAFFVRGGPAPVPVNVLIATVLTLGYFAIAQALTSVFPIMLKLDARRDMLRLLGVVTVVSLIMGLLYSGILLVSKIGPTERYFGAILRFWIGNSVGILVTLPLLLMLLDAERRVQMKTMLWRSETLAQIAAIVFVFWLVFGHAELEDFRRFYLLFLPLIWIAMRSGMAGTALATALIQGGVIVAVQAGQYQTLTIFELQALLMALTITGFFLGVTVEERERAALELRQSLRLAAASEMAAALAHELNQPLTALSSYAKASELLADSPDISRRQLRETLKKMVGEAGRAADVVRRLRDFFTTGATRLQDASLPQLVENVIGSLQERIDTHGISVEKNIVEPVLNVLVDSLQIEVVIRNLVLNAIEAVANKQQGAKTILVAINHPDSTTLQLSVTDSGTGITTEQMRHLFEPFSTTKASGMGMGLSISRAIIEGHGGRLWAIAGRRGVVCFTLPLREAMDG